MDLSHYSGFLMQRYGCSVHFFLAETMWVTEENCLLAGGNSSTTKSKASDSPIENRRMQVKNLSNRKGIFHV
jgi:hypothetical protein